MSEFITTVPEALNKRTFEQDLADLDASLDALQNEETSSLFEGVTDSVLGKLAGVVGLTFGAAKALDANPSMSRRAFLTTAGGAAVAAFVPNSAEASESNEQQPPLPKHITELIEKAQRRRTSAFTLVDFFGGADENTRKDIILVLGDTAEDYEKVKAEYDKLQGFPAWHEHHSLRYVRPDFAETLKALANIKNKWSIDKGVEQEERRLLTDSSNIHPNDELYAMQQLQKEAAQDYVKAWNVNPEANNAEALYRFARLTTFKPAVAQSKKELEIAHKCFGATFNFLKDPSVILPKGEDREEWSKECQTGAWRVSHAKNKRATVVMKSGTASYDATAELFCNGKGEVCVRKGVSAQYRSGINTETFPTFVIAKTDLKMSDDEFKSQVAEGLKERVFRTEAGLGAKVYISS